MATLEGEVLILGIYKNVQELEESLSLPELEVMVSAAREKEMRHHRFMAALKGIDLDDSSDTVDRVAEMKQRLESERRGKSIDTLEFEGFGFDVETEGD